MPLSIDERQRLLKARLLGAGRLLSISLSDNELVRLISVVLKDLGQKALIPDEFADTLDSHNYYDIPLDWFYADERTDPRLLDLYEKALSSDPDFSTFFTCAAELHKRRRKFEQILSGQPLPTPIQIGPRTLLEYGLIDQPQLASWMTWRKWLYDVDNRAAQETGYLFEPILTNSIGGVSFGSKASPVRRRLDQTKGRQVDCILDGDAYEFKLRVTIAASGQGRFGEEIDFALDCVSSGFRPILVVLDPTPNPRLADLRKAFEDAGGRAFIGASAWQHLEERAGPAMARFIERYVRVPVSALDEHQGQLKSLKLERLENSIQIEVGGELAAIIARAERPELAPSDDSSENKE